MKCLSVEPWLDAIEKGREPDAHGLSASDRSHPNAAQIFKQHGPGFAPDMEISTVSRHPSDGDYGFNVIVVYRGCRR